MRTITITILTLALALGGAACGNSQGSDGDVLHLNGMDITVRDFRARMESQIVQADNEQAGSAQSSCQLLTELSPDQAANALGIKLADTGPTDVIDPVELADAQAHGAVPVPGQEVDRANGLRAMALILAECKRITQ